MRIKQAKPIRHQKKLRQYTQQQMLAAYDEVLVNKTAVKRAAAMFGVPVQSLRDRVLGKVEASTRKSGVCTLLDEREELSLVEHVEKMAGIGYGYTQQQLKGLAAYLIFFLGKERRGRKLEMSKNWLAGFISRWQSRLKITRSQSLELARARGASKVIIDNYYDKLKDILEKYNFCDNPHLIYNLDETGIQSQTKAPKIIASKNSKTQTVSSPKGNTMTIIGCANAVGSSLPPMFIFKGKRLMSDLCVGALPGSSFCMSDSGWSNSEVFQTYLEQHFIKYTPANNGEHVLLLYDGHTSHISSAAIEWAKSQNVILFVLPPHTSHLLQPKDVSCYGPLKTFYYAECNIWMKTHIGRCITRFDMCGIASKAYSKAMSMSNILAGFRKTGISPLNESVIRDVDTQPSVVFEQQLDEIMSHQNDMVVGRDDTAANFLAEKVVNHQEKSRQKKKRQCGGKPQPSGEPITEGNFQERLQEYTLNVQEKNILEDEPQPSTSGIRQKSTRKRSLHSEDVDSCVSDDDDSDACCVCGKNSPPALRDIVSLVIVKWAQCDTCGHWCHLRFCSPTTVVRRHVTFLCPHCC